MAFRDRDAMIAAIRLYFEGCNEVSEEKLRRCLTADAVHYLPAGMGPPIHGVEAVLARWGADVRANGSSWTVQEVFADTEAGIGVAEWTGLKPGLGKVLRGAELYRFTEDGLIDEIRIYYASPRDDGRAVNELDGYAYADRPLVDALVSGHVGGLVGGLVGRVVSR
ncbi:nuclear transport factor 2 family protein [Nonomuraea rubra]|uniref:SnoaL-like domain-containing protein n=1 Tax=Nonomuraea rubra TaxID=46180 RepID=A0A7X0NPI5_9ACTN|nr:nuclear transport factor 2 family protein [Nonomuraea rubra]MBB6547255.1 hypothetical protein [Nonomuraea rubra]